MPSEVAFTLSSNLREWRQKGDRKLVVCAREFGVAPSTWDHWESGRRFPSSHNLSLLSQYTKVAIQCLVCEAMKRCNRLPPARQ